MSSDFASQLRAYAEVIVRVGLNLQKGQKLLLAEPYELQGVARESVELVEAVTQAAQRSGGEAVEVIWGDPARIRALAEKADWRGAEALAAANARRMMAHLSDGGAFLFLLGSHPRLLEGIAAKQINELRGITWEHFGPVVHRLMAGAVQWSLAPAPTPAWADAAFGDLPLADRMPALWEAVLTSCRCMQSDPVMAWETHLTDLTCERDRRNAQRLRTLRFVGERTDLTLSLPLDHLWSTTRLTTARGIPYTVNLPTDEVFTAPDKGSASGHVCITAPVAYGGSLIEGIYLEFRDGRVVEASAGKGAALLREILQTDSGAGRLGEVALVPTPWGKASQRCYRHVLLDENRSNHIALGSAYSFCHRKTLWPAWSLNRSLIHVDLPLSAELQE